MVKATFELFLPDRSVGEITNITIAETTILTIVWCPPGTFIMGGSANNQYSSNRDKKQHEVELTYGFWISQLQITQNIWETVMAYKFRPQEELDSGMLPVEGASWDTAMAFCNKLTDLLRNDGILNSSQSVSLPTEAQWEYSCKAGTNSDWYFGNDEGELDKYAWYQANSGNIAHQVGLKKPNQWGIYDLYGNVTEWCLDDFYEYETSKEVNPLHLNENSQLKIVRGGSYNHLAKECRSSTRETILKNNPFSEPTGIRVILFDRKMINKKPDEDITTQDT